MKARHVVTLLALGIAAPAQASDLLQLDAFGSVGANYSSASDDDLATGFGIGEFTLLATSAPADHLQMLGELSVQSTRLNRFAVGLERLQVRYAFDDRLSLSAGRLQQSIGYFNTNFIHAALLNTAVERPEVIADPELGGLLPTQIVGAECAGELPAGPLHLGYAFDLGNGRGPTSGTDLLRAASGAVGLNTELYLSLPSVGLRFGGNGLLDGVPANPDLHVGELHGFIHERIAGVHLVYDAHELLGMAEWYLIQHDLGGGDVRQTTAGFVEVSRKFGSVSPYLRVNQVEFDSRGDPFYNGHPEVTSDISNVVAGAKWTPLSQLALKAELEAEREGLVVHLHGRLQAAFGF